MRRQALWQVSEWRKRRQKYAEQRPCLDELVALGTATGLPELQARALAELSRCVRNMGDIAQAVDTATRAHELAKDGQLPAHVRVQALIPLVTALLEAERVTDAATCTDELPAAEIWRLIAESLARPWVTPLPPGGRSAFTPRPAGGAARAGRPGRARRCA
ncbi:hypothetical protein [Streptomyces sp. NPDC052114]|uniref:hypothetical protein n=1 Tax=unclassified Streptomyces TaxID=2593676 RepID=UPI00343B5B6E